MGRAAVLVFRVSLMLTAVLFVSARPTSAAGANDACRLLWADVNNVAPFAFEGAAEEAVRILARVGLQCVFTRGSASDGDEIFVVLLRRPQGRSTGKRLIMGNTETRPTKPGETGIVWVYIEPILQVLRLRSAANDRQAVTRAIGRVIAHEVIHALAPQMPHSKRGLMAAFLTAGELADAKVQLDPIVKATLSGPPGDVGRAAR